MKKTSLFTNYSRNLKVKSSKEKPASNHSLNKTQNVGKNTRLNMSLGKSYTPFQISKNKSTNYNTTGLKVQSKTIETSFNFNRIIKRKDNNTISASKSYSSQEKNDQSLKEKDNNSNRAESNAKLIKLKKPSKSNVAGITVSPSDIKIIDDLLSTCAELTKSKGSKIPKDHFSNVAKYFETATETLSNNKYKRVFKYLFQEFKELQTLAFSKKNNNFQQFSSVNLKKGNTKLLISTPNQKNKNGDATNTLQSIEVINTSSVKAKPVNHNSRENANTLLNKFKTPAADYGSTHQKIFVKKATELRLSLSDKKKDEIRFIQSLNSGHINLNLNTTINKPKQLLPMNNSTPYNVLSTEPNKQISFNGKDPVILMPNEDDKSEEHRLKINKSLIDDLEAIYFEDRVKPRCNSTFTDIPKLRFDFNSGEDKRK